MPAARSWRVRKRSRKYSCALYLAAETRPSSACSAASDTDRRGTSPSRCGEPWNEIERASRPIWTSERADIETRLNHGERRLSNDVEKLWAEPVFTLSGSLSTLSSSGTTCPSSQPSPSSEPSGGLVGLEDDGLDDDDEPSSGM